MELNRGLLYLIGYLVIGLNIIQVTCKPTEGKAAEVKGENVREELVRRPSHQEIVTEIIKTTQVILEENTRLLLEKKEIKELLGEKLEVLKKFKQLDSDIGLFASGEIAIRYYLKSFPGHASLLDLAVENWRKIVADSSKKVEKTSKEIYESLMNADPSKDASVYSEIAKKVVDSEHYKMKDDVEYTYFNKAVFIRLSSQFEVLFNSELERELFKKIATFYKQGLFDDIYETMGDEAMDFLFNISSIKA
ncbi:hypothetical protein LSTR_LSTR008133 [Laodelphax striatellus]|uniref:Uncharacterized protein n=1 Tax=Laodelphax striatellus TaxID=195883 RepID=A0A482XSY7_LAOST|nr:hypothetical protein LSTR_LSTR008133 [Laodelphax striatellus]